jgi:hypothetical protein
MSLLNKYHPPFQQGAENKYLILANKHFCILIAIVIYDSHFFSPFSLGGGFGLGGYNFAERLQSPVTCVYAPIFLSPWLLYDDFCGREKGGCLIFAMPEEDIYSISYSGSIYKG